MSAVSTLVADGAVLAHVRRVTRPAHDRLEGSLGLLDPDLDSERYLDLLQRFYGFWLIWQPQIATLLGDDIFLAPRRRLHLLHADLIVLGMTALGLDLLPRCPAVPLGNAQEALGSLYVMEGSSLGGRLIKRNVEDQLGEIGQASCSYFRGYGPRTGAMWSATIARLCQEPVAHKEAVGRGAVATFAQLDWWLTRST